MGDPTALVMFLEFDPADGAGGGPSSCLDIGLGTTLFACVEVAS